MSATFKLLRALPGIIAFSGLVFVVGCGSGTPGSLAPADPEVTVREFLDAVKANDLTAMSLLWGNDHGPAAGYMDPQELRKRLTVIQVYLQHDSFEFAQGGNLAMPGDDQMKVVPVRLLRASCIAVVPFRMVPWSGKWLVNDIDLTPIGNPARTCGPQP
jgi:hypothetical protein